DGSPIWARVTAAAVRDASGRWAGSIGTIMDISQQKLAREAMRRSEERYRSLVEATSAIVWDTSASGEFTSDQPDWTAFTGQEGEELSGLGWLDVVHPEDRDRAARAWSEAVAHRSPYFVEYRLRRRDGV